MNFGDLDLAAGAEPGPLRQALGAAEPFYLLPKDDVAQEVIIPALTACRSAQVMMGFFTSGSFAEIAPGLASYLTARGNPLQLIISPYLSTEDQAVLSSRTDMPQFALEWLTTALPDADALATHTLRCLAWLLDAGRIQIKVALMRDALFHPKVWLFGDNASIGAGDSAALHGSANMTSAGLGRNREQLSLSRGWSGDDAQRTCQRLAAEFEMLWHGGDADCVVVDLPDAFAAGLIRDYKSGREPSEDDFRLLWRRARGLPDEPPREANSAYRIKAFTVPTWLSYRAGDYAHQGLAIDAWEAAGRHGVLEMCTGSGKTLTAMTAAQLLHAEVGPLLVVVSAPYKVLLEQWCGEIALFGPTAINLTECAGPGGRQQAIANARRRLRLGISPVEVLVVSNDTLTTPAFLEQVGQFAGPKLLIADECHNLGAPEFLRAPPNFFDYRLGLSATPVRQYDDVGTDGLFAFFGPVVFSFGLEEAIGRCLTPYDYFPHFVSLDADEMATWRDLSEQIARLAWKIDAGAKDDHLNYLLLQRRRVIEVASAKLGKLAQLIDAEDIRQLKYTLIYATDKDPAQLDAVNGLLLARDVRFHQLTAEETSNADLTARLLSSFQKGDLQVLTAKRVLDEGVNIPEIERAFILASTTVRRQWVQRRGRLLRMCKAIGKTHAVIHDLVALPPFDNNSGRMDSDERKIINAELDRVWEFARLSRNAATSDGPFAKVEQLRALLKDGD